LLVADWAESVSGKLYAQGIGWSGVRANVAVQLGVAIVVKVEYTETNVKHRLTARLVNGDGEPYLNEEEQPVRAQFDFEVGRPPGVVHGETQVITLAANFAGLKFAPGRYSWDLYNGDNKLPDAWTFTAIDPGTGVGPW
jgi:hypothetical protein